MTTFRSPVAHSDDNDILRTSEIRERYKPRFERRFDSDVFSVSDALAELLTTNGIREAFGVLGGAVAPLCDALAAASIQVTSFRHESGACFAAIESYFANGIPVAVFATTGPGLTNALTGLTAARWEGAKLIFVSGTTPVSLRGRWAFQETSPANFPQCHVFPGGQVFHSVSELCGPQSLADLAQVLNRGLQRPHGFVAHIAVPIDVQRHHCPNAAITPKTNYHSAPSNPTSDTVIRVRDCARLLEQASFVVWAGFGARFATRQVQALATRMGAPVMCSPRAKGLFPERHPQYLGVTGFGGHCEVQSHFENSRPDYTLVLGTRLGEFTSFWDPNLLPKRALIQVDLEESHMGLAFPDFSTMKIRSEIGEFLNALLDQLPARHAAANSVAALGEPPAPSGLTPVGRVRPEFLMRAIQDVVVDGTDAIVLTEAGNAFAWTTHFLRFSSPGRYRVSVGFGSMGHASAGVVGAAHGSGKKAVAVVGDGALLMLNEINTAVALQSKSIWIVLNDACYGMIDAGMQAQGFEPVAVHFPRVDFAAVARAMGAQAIHVADERDLHKALRDALAMHGPCLIDVIIDSTRQAPFLRRIDSLVAQGAKGRCLDVPR